jgi:hypothetical protein
MSSEPGVARRKPRSSNIQGIGGTRGKALALSIVGATVYGLIKLVDLVTD